jgi:plasmid stabilization system protein ParE
MAPHLGIAGVQIVARSVRPEWSENALADLDRFERFLRRQHPHLAPVVADAIVDAAQVLVERPKLGRPIAGRQEYRDGAAGVECSIHSYFNTATTVHD